MATFEREVELGIAEAFWGILKNPMALGGECSVLSNPFSTLNGDVARVIEAGVVEGDAALERAGGIVEVNDGLLDAFQTFVAALDQMLTCLHEDLNRNIFGDAIFLDQAADELEFGIRGRREADFDLGKSYAHEQVKILQFFLDRHRGWQGLVAITEINGAPDGSLRDRLIGPGPIRQGYRRKWSIFGDGLLLHGGGEA